MPKWIWNLIILIWSAASGPLREQIEKSVAEWEKTAKLTQNPWDDIVVGLIKWLLNIKSS